MQSASLRTSTCPRAGSRRAVLYYSDEIRNQVISANDIVDVIGQYVELKRSGSQYMGLCPFHSEHTPSFSVSRTKQVYHCFGCGESGNVITFLKKYNNMTYQEAMEYLASRAGIVLPKEEASPEQKERNKKRDILFSINKDTATYYYRLLRSPKGQKGMAYLKGRALSDKTMNQFGLGYADGGNSDLVRYLQEKGYSSKDILDSGVAVFREKDGLKDKFWNRVMYPIMDASGRVIAFGGRVMGDGIPKYLNSPETLIFEKKKNLYGLNIARNTVRNKDKDYFILCEGYMDVISQHQAGFPMAIASLGTSFTVEQAQVIRRYVTHVFLAYDSDGAGVRAAMRNIGILRDAGVSARVIDLRPYKDPDEFCKNLGTEEYQKRIDNAENSFYYQIRQIEGNYRLDDPESRTAFYHEIAKRLCGFDDEMERENYISAMAQKYGIQRDVLSREVAGYKEAGIGRQSFSEGPVRITPAPQNPTAQKKASSIEKAKLRNEGLLLTWISDDPDVYLQIRDYIGPEDFSEGLAREAAQDYFKMLEEHYGDPLKVEAEGTKAPGFTPAIVIGSFEDEDEQKDVADIFNTRIKGLT
ncbi:MAG TPA: DNA primase, partial [Lachnospiraceae bacterium]|nr:DNA primase [Lachnospiraceae bacterium]